MQIRDRDFSGLAGICPTSVPDDLDKHALAINMKPHMPSALEADATILARTVEVKDLSPKHLLEKASLHLSQPLGSGNDRLDFDGFKALFVDESSQVSDGVGIPI